MVNLVTNQLGHPLRAATCRKWSTHHGFGDFTTKNGRSGDVSTAIEEERWRTKRIFFWDLFWDQNPLILAQNCDNCDWISRRGLPGLHSRAFLFGEQQSMWGMRTRRNPPSGLEVWRTGFRRRVKKQLFNIPQQGISFPPHCWCFIMFYHLGLLPMIEIYCFLLVY